ncbi:MAG TPA: hypothetical protein VFW07_12930 [Parafilimonas sp.]|nr:hypothetical protein [Parafilimonas sp.]
MTSVLDRELVEYFMRLSEPQKQSLLDMMKSFLNPLETSVYPVSPEQYNRELDEAMERINNGSFTTLEQLEKEMQSW